MTQDATEGRERFYPVSGGIVPNWSNTGLVEESHNGALFAWSPIGGHGGYCVFGNRFGKDGKWHIRIIG